MRHLLGSLAVVVGVVALTGCAGSMRAKGAEDPLTALNANLENALPSTDTLTALNEELSHTLPDDGAVGTTTLTNATLLRDLGPMPLPDERMPLSVLYPPALVTWGAPAIRLIDIPEARE